MKIKVLAAAAAIAALGIATRAPAQSGLREAPAGYCFSNSMSTSTGLATFTGPACNGGTNLGNYTYAAICAYVQGVVWRDDGTAPTATPGGGGQGLAAGQCMPYNGNFQSLRFIQQAPGAIAGVSLYK